LKAAGIMKRKTAKALPVSSPHKRRTQSKVAGVMKTKKNANTATDWNKFDALSEEEVHTAALNDPDAQPLSEQQLAKMRRPSLVKRLRIKLGLSQTEFAERFHIPIGTLRDWEQHRRDPDQAALSYLKVIDADPAFVARALAA
jgi:putative transcriptional regulator